MSQVLIYSSEYFQLYSYSSSSLNLQTVFKLYQVYFLYHLPSYHRIPQSVEVSWNFQCTVLINLFWYSSDCCWYYSSYICFIKLWKIPWNNLNINFFFCCYRFNDIFEVVIILYYGPPAINSKYKRGHLPLL